MLPAITLIPTYYPNRPEGFVMSSLYLAVFLGSKDSPQMKAWMALPDDERAKRMNDGLAAWHGWVEKHRAAVADLGGPLGKTKRVDAAGMADVSNELSGYAVVRADSHEAAAAMFENHPHFTIFPGVAVEIMPVMPIPGA
jgi:hypothetical protein